MSSVAHSKCRNWLTPWHRGSAPEALIIRLQPDLDFLAQKEYFINSPDHDDRQSVALKDAVQFALDEARMILPGVQALFGFQLIAVFNQRFDDLLGWYAIPLAAKWRSTRK